MTFGWQWNDFLVGNEMTNFLRRTGSGNETTYNHFISWLLIDRNMAILHHLTLKFEFGICSLLPDNKNNVADINNLITS